MEGRIMGAFNTHMKDLMNAVQEQIAASGGNPKVRVVTSAPPTAGGAGGGA